MILAKNEGLLVEGFNQSLNQSVNQSIGQSISESTNLFKESFGQL